MFINRYVINPQWRERKKEKKKRPDQLRRCCLAVIGDDILMCNRLDRTLIFLDWFFVCYFPPSVVILSLLRFVGVASVILDDVNPKCKQVDPNCSMKKKSV